MYVVVVTFQIKPGMMDSFLPATWSNAATSLARESGCHRFDVCTDPNRPDEVFLYEIYASPEAFEAHLASDHFTGFDRLARPMVAGKDVRTYGEVVS